MLTQDVWISIGRLTLAAILAPAFLGKVVGLRHFVASVQKYGVPSVLARPTALMVATIEGVLTGLLLTGWALPFALGGCALLFTAFAIVTGLTLLQNGRLTECGCLGKIGRLTLGRASAILNIALAGTALVSLIAVTRSSSNASSSPSFWIWLLGSVLACTYWLVVYAFSVLRQMNQVIAEEMQG